MGGKKKKKENNGGGDKDNSAAIIAMMQAQMAAQAEAERQALLESQRQAAYQREAQSEILARQNLSSQEQLQKGQDRSTLEAAALAAQAAGGAITGGGFDINKSKQTALGNLGAASGMLPSTPANLAGSSPTDVNPALQDTINKGLTPTSQFQMPSMTGIQFGGS